jgi:signal transduction histidine kinase/HAMP domain-containing protein
MRRYGSILTQMLIAFSVFAVLIGAATVLNYVAVGRQNAGAQQVTGRYTVLQQEESALESAYGTAEFAVLFYNVTGDRSYLLTLGGARASFDSNLAQLRRHATPGLRRVIEEQARTGADWFALSPKIVGVTPRSPAARVLLARANRLGVDFLTSTITALGRLHNDIEQLTTSSKQALQTGLVWSAVALGIAVLLVLASSLSTVYTITRPLRALTATVRRLTQGDHAARAAAAGSAEVREVAHSINAQAEEADRLRSREAESNRLRAASREAGLRIREPLVEEDVLREARRALEQTVGADRVSLRLIEEDRLTLPVGDDLGPGAADDFTPHLTDDEMTGLRQLFHAQGSVVIQDVQGEEGNQIPSGPREAIRGLGVMSQIVTPFGVGPALLGILVAERLAPHRPWTPAQVDAVESIAADLGRGLNHARLYEAEDRLVENLRSLDKAKSDFFATVSHELRSPLTSIEGYVEMLSEDPGHRLDPGQRHMVDVIDRSTDRLRNLIEDVFTLAKLESGAFETTTRPVDIAETVKGAVEAIQPLVTEKRLSLTVTGSGNGLVVEGDASQLERVVINLLSNAVKFTPAGGHITVSASAQDESALITVTDTGIGIPRRDQQELFTRFFRASNAVEQAIPGTGLGLAIIHTIVVNHGGAIDLESREGAGTTFTVRLPRQVPAPP